MGGLAGLMGGSDAELAMRKLTPTAAAINEIKSGMSVTDMYTTLVEKSNALMASEKENERINVYMSQILNEITTKAPIIQRQREDYQRVVTSHDQLASRLDEAHRARSDLENNVVHLNKQLATLTTDRDEHQQLTMDLGLQVQHLVKKQLQQASRNTYMKNPVASLAQASGGGGGDAANRVITENLVAFDNVDELQRKNANLLTVVRRLKSQCETLQSDPSNQDELKEALAHVQKLRDRRQRQEVMVQSIIQQRDMYRMMAQQGVKEQPGPSSSSSSSSSSSPPPASTATSVAGDSLVASASASGNGGGHNETNNEANNAVVLSEMRAEFEALREEQKETIVTLRATVSTARASENDMRVKHGRMQAEVSFLNGKYDTLYTTTEGERNELSRLRAKNVEGQQMVVEHQRRLKKMENDLSGSRSEVHGLKQTKLRVEAERDLHKSAKSRAETDVKRLKEERSRQSSVLEAMQQLEKNLDSRAASNLDRKESKIERMEEELTSLQKEVKEKEERLESIRAQTGRDETTMKGHIERLKGEWNKDTLHWLLALLFGIAALESFTPQKKTTFGSLH